MNLAPKLITFSLCGGLILTAHFSGACDKVGKDASAEVASSKEVQAKRIQKVAEEYVRELELQGLSTLQKSQILNIAIAVHKELAIWNGRAKLTADQELAATKAFEKLELQISRADQVLDENQRSIDLAKALKESQEAIVLTAEQKKAMEEVSRLQNELWEKIWEKLTDKQRALYLDRNNRTQGTTPQSGDDNQQPERP